MKPKFRIGEKIYNLKTNYEHHLIIIDIIKDFGMYKYKVIKHIESRYIGNIFDTPVEEIDKKFKLIPINYNDYWAKLNA